MDSNYVFLMSVYNDIEAENVAGILEMEGIKPEFKSPGSMDFINAFTDAENCIDIYVPKYEYENAREIIETEMTRGDL